MLLSSATRPVRYFCMAGDSLTAGVGTSPADSAKNAGYRYLLQQALGNAGRGYVFTGTQQRGDLDSTYGSLHDGTAGITQAGLLTQLQLSVMPLGPEYLLYLCGVNDLFGGASAATALVDLQANLTAIWAAAWRLKAIVLGELLPNGDSTVNGKVNTFNAGLPTAISSYNATGRRVVIAPLNAAVPYGVPNYGADLTHPNATGYGLLATVGWLPTILGLI